MILRILATLPILGLLALDVALPNLSLGRRGTDASVRADSPKAVARVGEAMPDFTLPDLDGIPVTLSALRGHRVLVTFERSVDW